MSRASRPEALARCLAALTLQDHPLELVLVADPGAVGIRPDLPAKRVAFDRPNISLARNLGLARAAGDVVLFIDDDALAAAHAAIVARLGADVRYPRYPAGAATKLSAAWLIDRAGFAKGFALPGGGAAISSKHTLALTNRGGTTADLIALARHVRDGVEDVFGVRLNAEPILIGTHL